ncbi:hypothetical protein DSO57_1013972 [Entomophthora muscae]|uniref:Uncharacterized protein n=1 Tax=Entomophthora muscae TaxID=34485 RepID=A0ACC2RWP8_9FUNG|nr:hypothetical protein DSO57_1013972 [Entomophthora muscae]
MLQLAGIEYDLFETQRFQHGIELAQTAPNLSLYDAIVSVGGDGVLHEVVNGSLTREDWKEVIKVPFGILPAGSANGVAVTLGFSDFHLASLNIIRGNTQKYDIAALYCTNRGDEITYSVLDAVNGYFSDVDDTADEFRWMGPLRLTVAAVVRSIFLKKYRTRIYYLPDDTNIDNCTVIKDKESPASLESGSKERFLKPGPKPSIPNVIKGYNCVTDPISERLSESWNVVDGAFGVTTITNVPFLTKDFRISGTASTSNGTLSLVHESKRLSAFGFLDALLKETSDPTKGEFVSNMKETLVHCVIIESLGLITKDKPANPNAGPSPHSQIIENRLVSWNPTAPGTFRVDGEVLKGTTAIQVQVLPGLINFICPNWL